MQNKIKIKWNYLPFHFLHRSHVNMAVAFYIFFSCSSGMIIYIAKNHKPFTLFLSHSKVYYFSYDHKNILDYSHSML